MRRVLVCVISIFFGVSSVNALDIPKDGLDIFSNMNSKFELKAIEISDLSKDPVRSEVAVLFTILLHTKEIDIHRMRGAVHNVVYSDQEGHEAVFEFDLDENGLPIEGTSREITINNCMNMANFNYYLPSEYPFGHFAADILPWLLKGNCPNDPTLISERIDAYILDFESGMTSIITTQSSLYHPKFHEGKNNMQLEAFSLLLKALELGGFNINELTPTDFKDEKVRLEIAKTLSNGLKVMLVED